MQNFFVLSAQFISEYFLLLLLGGILIFVVWNLLQTSERFLQIILKIFPKSYKTHYKLGYLFSEKSERKDDAEKEFRLSISLEPNFPFPYYRLVRILWEKSNSNDEIELLIDEMYKRFPNKSSTHLMLGYFYEERKDILEAEEHYRKAIALAPRSSVAYDYLVKLLHYENRNDEAQQIYLKAIKLLPRNNEIYHLLTAYNFHLNGDFSKAATAYKKVVKKNPNNVNAHLNLGLLFHEELNKPDESEQAYRRAIQLSPKNPDAYLHLGLLLHEHFHRYVEAEAMFNKTIEIDPQDETAFYNISCIKAINKDTDSSFKYLKEAIEKGFDRSFAWEDPELENMREDPRFIKIVGSHTKKG
jgi:tetratricopeptide (TPR) repeat protein